MPRRSPDAFLHSRLVGVPSAEPPLPCLGYEPFGFFGKSAHLVSGRLQAPGDGFKGLDRFKIGMRVGGISRHYGTVTGKCTVSSLAGFLEARREPPHFLTISCASSTYSC